MTSHRGQGAFGPLSENPTPVNAVSSTQEDVVADVHTDAHADVVDEIGSLSIASATQTEQVQEQEQVHEQAQTEYGLQEPQVP